MRSCLFKHLRCLLVAVFVASAGVAMADNHLFGDVNGDGEVNVTDVMAVTSYILGSTPAGFNPVAANVNGDDELNVTDAMGIVNIILHKTISGSSASTLKFAQSTIEKNYGDAPFTADLYRAGSTGAVTYTSSAPAVVAVDAATGVMTVRSSGTATITATLAADASYSEATATLTVTVTGGGGTDNDGYGEAIPEGDQGWH